MLMVEYLTITNYKKEENISLDQGESNNNYISIICLGTENENVYIHFPTLI